MFSFCFVIVLFKSTIHLHYSSLIPLTKDWNNLNSVTRLADKLYFFPHLAAPCSWSQLDIQISIKWHKKERKLNTLLTDVLVCIIIYSIFLFVWGQSEFHINQPCIFLLCKTIIFNTLKLEQNTHKNNKVGACKQ